MGKTFILNDVFVDITKGIKEIYDQRSYKICWILAYIYPRRVSLSKKRKKGRNERVNPTMLEYLIEF